MSIRSLLVHTCAVQTQTQTKSATGGAVVGWASKASGVVCRVEKMTQDRAAMVYGKFDATKMYTVYFDTEQSLSVDDRLLIAGEKYRVVSVINTDLLNRLWRVDVMRLPTGEA